MVVHRHVLELSDSEGLGCDMREESAGKYGVGEQGRWAAGRPGQTSPILDARLIRTRPVPRPLCLGIYCLVHRSGELGSDYSKERYKKCLILYPRLAESIYCFFHTVENGVADITRETRWQVRRDLRNNRIHLVN